MAVEKFTGELDPPQTGPKVEKFTGELDAPQAGLKVEKFTGELDAAPLKAAPSFTPASFFDEGLGFVAPEETKKPESVLEGKQIPAPAPGATDPMLNPEFVRSVRARLDAMPEKERTKALNNLANQPNVYGRAARVIREQYKALDATDNPTLRKGLDRRIETQTARFIEQGAAPEVAENIAKQQALNGVITPDLQQVSRDVEGEQLAEEAEAQKKELADAGFWGRVRASTTSQYTKSGLGLLHAYADLTGDDQMSKDLVLARKIEEARAGAIPQGQGVFEKSAQGAMTSLATQAPFMVLSTLSGTAAPILAQAAIQQFGDSYSESRAAGKTGAEAAARAIPMAAAEVVFEQLGMPKALAGLRKHFEKEGAEGIGDYMAKAIAHEIPAELATTATQYGIDALPGIGTTNNPTLVGLYEQLEETLRQTVMQSGVTAGATIGAVKGLQKVTDMLPGPSYEGVAESMARNRGFLQELPKREFEQQLQTQPAPTATPAAEPAPAATEEAKPETIAEATKTESEVVPDVQAIIDRHVQNGVPEATARRMAESQVATQEVVDEETGEITHVAGPNAEPVGAGAEVAVEPSGGAAEGIGQPERNGNVPAVEDVGHVAAGEGQQPAALIEEPTKAEEQPYVQTPEDLQKQQAAFEANREKVRQIAKRNFDTAVDQVNSFDYGGNLDAALDAYRTNMFETLGEEGINKYDPDQPFWIRAADREFDRLTEEYKAKQETSEGEETKPEQAATEETTTAAPTTETTTTAPATKAPAETPVPKKRGPKGPRLTEEQRAASQERRRAQQAAWKQAGKAVDEANSRLEDSKKPVDEEAAGNEMELIQMHDDKRRGRTEALTDLYDLARENKGNQQGERAMALFEAEVTPQEKQDITQGYVARQQAKYGLRKGPLASGGRGVLPSTAVDARFNKFTNGAQALNHIVKTTRNPFIKAIAKRLSGFVNGVDFHIIEQGQELPQALKDVQEDWDRARGLYLRDEATGKRSVYLRGASFGEDHGINSVTILHELLHAATQQKLYLGTLASYRGYDLNSSLVKATRSLSDLMGNVELAYYRALELGMVSPELRRLVNSTIDEYGDPTILTSSHEFLAYGLTDHNFQQFLMNTLGKETEARGPKGLFSVFLDNVRRLLGLNAKEADGLYDLVVAYDKILASNKTENMRNVEKSEMALAAKRPPLLAAKQVKEANTKGQRAVQNSKDGYELGNATADWQKNKDPRVLAPLIRAAWGASSSAVRGKMAKGMTTESIVTNFENKIPALLTTYRALQRMDGARQNLLRGVARQSDAIIDYFQNHPKERDAFESLVNSTTIDQYDPSQPGAKKNKPHDDAYAALSDQGKQVYAQLRQYYQDMHAYQRQILEDQIAQLDLPEGERNKIIKELRLIYEKGNVITPYFPLMRYGDYVLKIKGFGPNKEDVSLRFESGLKRDFAALQYARKMGRSLSELEQDESVKKYNDTNSADMRRTVERTSELLKSVYSAIEGATLQGANTKDALKDSIYQAYLATMPEQSVRKMFMHREGIAGFSPDILRNVNVSGARMASQFARLEHAPAVRQGLESARTQLEGQEEYTPVVDEMERLIVDTINPQQVGSVGGVVQGIGDLLTKATFLTFLTGWKTALIQPLDTFNKGLPILSANHGVAEASAELARTMQIWNQFGVAETLPDGSTRYRAPSIEFAKGLTSDERRAIYEMNAYGLTSNTLANDVIDRYSTTSSIVPKFLAPNRTVVLPKSVEGLRTAVSTLFLGGLLHHSERLSREALYLTSYRLSRAKGKSHADAVEMAIRETNEAFFNYASYNRPMIMRGGGRFAAMYKFFPVATYNLMATNFFKMLPVLNKTEKKQAAIKFFGVSGMHALMGGLTALPAFSLIMNLIGAAWNRWQKDPDAPEDMKSMDYNTWFRIHVLPQFLDNTWLAGAAEGVETGLLNKITNWNFSGSISLDNMLYREPLVPGRTVNASIANWAFSLSGPVPSAILNYHDGYQLAANGDYEAATEKLLPGSISNLIKAHEYATRGIHDNLGNLLVPKEKVTAGDVVGRALGFQPSDVAANQEIAIKTGAIPKIIAVEKSGIESELKTAFQKYMDTSRSLEAHDRFGKSFNELLIHKIPEFNQKYPEYEITPESVDQMLTAEQETRASRESNAGVLINDKTARVASPAAQRTTQIRAATRP